MTLRFVKISLFIAAALFPFLGTRPAAAHPMPNSQVMLDINRADVDITLHIPLVELEVAYGKPLSQDPDKSIAASHADLAAYFARHIAALGPNGQPWQVSVNDVERGEDQTPPFWTQATPFVDAHVHLTPPPGVSVRRFTLNYDVVVHQLLTHVALVSVRRDWDSGLLSGSPVVLGELRTFNKSFDVNVPAGSPWRGMQSVVRLGMNHIAEGVDHLLFLLVLLLPAGLRACGAKWGPPLELKKSVTGLLKIVTAFTLGHSLTLALGALGFIHAPSAPIETLIAVSIFVSAVHAVRPLFPGREAFIAAGFGLIHGLAFAGVIAEFRLDTAHTVLTILGFNVGIELMQLAIVALTVPWLLLLARTRTYTPVRIVGATLAGIAALGWIGERALGWHNPVGVWVEQIAGHAVWIVAFLITLSVGATLCERHRKAAPLAETGTMAA